MTQDNDLAEAGSHPFKLVRLPVILTAVVFTLQVIVKPMFCTEVPVGYGGALAFGGSVENRVLDEGPHFKWPWQHTILMSLRTLADARQTTPTDSNNQAIGATVQPQVWIDPKAIPALARNYGTFDNVMKSVVDPQINQATRGTVSTHTPEQLVWTRPDIVRDVRASLQAAIGDQLEAKGVDKNAVQVGLIAITDFSFSDAVRHTLEQKAESGVKAKTATAQAQIRAIDADKDGQVTEITADGNATATQIIAEANAYKVQKVGEAAAAAASVSELEAIQHWIDAGGHSSRVQLAPGANVIISATPAQQ
jgi:regulator of protease activity HflC (stomatin/prohibitin superfamily)